MRTDPATLIQTNYKVKGLEHVIEEAQEKIERAIGTPSDAFFAKMLSK